MNRRALAWLLTALTTLLLCIALGSGPAPEEGGPQVGVQVHGAWTDWSPEELSTTLDRLADARVAWIRVDVGWLTLEERGPGRLSDWYVARVDRVVDAARARGLEVLVTLWGTPAWANGGRDRNVPPHDPREYGRIAGWAASHFRGRVAAWEVWNEPNDERFFAGRDAREYVALLRAAHAAVRAGDPGARVVLAGPSYNDTGWLEAVYRAGGRGAFDVLATHPYLAPADAPPERPDTGTIWTLEHVSQVRSLMIRWGDGALPIWFTEFGWSSHDNPPDIEPWRRGVSPQAQAAYLVRTIELVRRRHPYVTSIFWYTARDQDSGDPHLDGYGLLTRDLQPKPVYDALRLALAR